MIFIQKTLSLCLRAGAQRQDRKGFRTHSSVLYICAHLFLLGFGGFQPVSARKKNTQVLSAVLLEKLQAPQRCRSSCRGEAGSPSTACLLSRHSHTQQDVLCLCSLRHKLPFFSASTWVPGNSVPNWLLSDLFRVQRITSSLPSLCQTQFCYYFPVWQVTPQLPTLCS